MIPVSEAREQLADLVNRVAYRRERITLGRRGKKIAAIVSAEDLELLEALEDAADLRLIAEALADPTNAQAKVITQRTLRNESGEIMRGLDRGESYIVTRNGVPVGELMPVRRREAVPAEMLLAALAGAPRIDPTRFRKDVDELIDQDPRPRA